MTLKQTVVGSLVGFGSLLGILLPGENFALPLGFFIAAGILHVWGFQPEVPRVTKSTVSRALEISRDVWIVTYIDPNMLEGGVEIRLQCFHDPDEPEQQLLVYHDHPEFETFRKLEPRCIIEFSYHPEMMMEGARMQTLSSYLSIFKIHPPGRFIPPNSGGNFIPATVH